MTQELSIEADPREDFGKNAARRLRHSGRVPAVVYGGGGPAIPVAVDPKKVLQILHSDAGHNAIFTLGMKGKTPARVMLRDWQVDPVTGQLLHVDLVRVTRGTKLRVKVPIQITGEPAGVKVQGGILEFVLREVEVECLPEDIPDHITADVTELTIGLNLRVSNLPLDPNKVKVLSDPNQVVAHVVVLKEEEEEKPAAEVAAAAPAEPELIRKGKAEEEAEPEEGAAEAKETKKEGKKET